MPVSYPQPNCPEAKSRFEFAHPTPSWIGLSTLRSGSIKWLADCLSMAFQTKTEISTPLSTGSVEVALEGHKFRRPVTGRRPWVTGVFPSRKIGRPVEYESMNEQALIEEMEVDPGVCDFRSQAVRFTFAMGGNSRQYTADVLRLLYGGTIEVIEAKSEPQAVLKDATYVDKLRRVHAICGVLGWKFSVYFGRDLRADNVFNFNVQTLVRHMNVPLPRNEMAAASRLVERRRTATSLGDIIDLYATPQEGAAKALGLIARGVLCTDLRYRLARPNTVTATEAGR